MAVVLPNGRNQFFAADGSFLSGGKVYTYVPGTSTPKDTYTTSAGSVANTNPVVLDTRGEAAIYWSGNYDVVLKTSAEATIWGPERLSEPETAGTAADILTDLADTSDVDNGDALVGVKRTESGSLGQTLHFWVQQSKLRTTDFFDHTTASAGATATGLALAISTARTSGKVLEFAPGATYTTNAQVAFLGTSGLRGLRFWGNGCTLYRNTGVGPVALLDSGADTDRCDDIEFIDFVLKGQASSTYGLDTRGISRSRLRARAVDVATGFRTRWSVLNDHHFTVSDNIDTFTVNPSTGLLVTQSSSGNYSAANRYHVVMEGPISDLGVNYEYGGLGNIFTGTCEAIPKGFRQQATAADALLLEMDFEGNSNYDLLIEGRGLTIRGGECSSAGSSGTIFLFSTASDVTFDGGFRRTINIDSAVVGTRINSTAVNESLGIAGTGATLWRGSGNVKVDTDRVITSLIPDQLGYVNSYTATLTGCTTSPTGTINYRQVGDVVTLDIPSGFTATSNTNACTLTGMPTSIRPSATRSDIGIVTENSGNVIGRFEIDSSGVITLRNGAGGTFTSSGTKGAQASTITYKV